MLVKNGNNVYNKIKLMTRDNVINLFKRDIVVGENNEKA